jgi:xanthine dehydrogenase YagT iron-sulfur-binding subunit
MDSHEVTRREFVGTVVAGSVAAALPGLADAQTAAPHTISCTLTINGQSNPLNIDSRVTLLDLLREHLRLTGTRRAAITANVAPARCWSMGTVSTPV